MKNIRPVSDLRNNFTEISREVHKSNQPVFLLKTAMEIWLCLALTPMKIYNLKVKYF